MSLIPGEGQFIVINSFFLKSAFFFLFALSLTYKGMLISCTDNTFLFDLPVFPLVPAALGPEVSQRDLSWICSENGCIQDAHIRTCFLVPLKQGS